MPCGFLGFSTVYGPRPGARCARQRPRQGQRGPIRNVAIWRNEHQTAGGQADHPVAVAANEIERVQVADDGDAEMLVDPQQCIHDHASVGGVERGDRLIGKDEIGLLHQRAGDSDALLLAAGELIGSLRGKRGNVELFQCRHGDGLVLGRPEARERAPGRHGAETAHQDIGQYV
jgi:hypothetical protein